MSLPKNMRAVRLDAYHEDVTEAIRGLNVVDSSVTPSQSPAFDDFPDIS